MSTGQPEKPKVVAFRDHEVIVPDTRKLRRSLRQALPGEPDPIESAERALGRLSGDFATWMKEECERLDAARRQRIAPATAGVVPVGSTFMDGFASAGRCAGLARRIRRRPGWKRTVNDCGKRKVNFGRAGRPVAPSSRGGREAALEG
jgi:hypothetical protein